MEGNKDEAARCIEMAKFALASGDKQHTLKFIRIARRLDPSLSLDDLLADCKKIDGFSAKNRKKEVVEQLHEEPSCSKPAEASNGGRNYREDHVKQIREIKMTKDYYAILGVEKNSSIEQIRKAYRKLSLKVHPDKNKAPGAEEAFKSVCRAFKCLSDEQSRRNYDRTGPPEEYVFDPLNNIRRGRRKTNSRTDFFNEDFDSDEIFKSFGTQGDPFGAHRAHRPRGRGRDSREHNAQRGGGEEGRGGISFIALFQILPILLIFLFACFPFPEPQYSLQKTSFYLIHKVTEKHGVDYYVKLEDFEQRFPLGSSSRDTLEHNVFKDYSGVLRRYCHIELRRRQWVKTSPTPHCVKLRNLKVS
ncbi:hypothetical protein Cni_G19082 [Canna indica]|uniref:J domain-containing protein n=1 Tax=Canna indica TaxID=4628 RepID=A0AAQ3KMF9_9LILI|nr:hypothetical protein Cni_G19082 [Canna indica]